MVNTKQTETPVLRWQDSRNVSFYRSWISILLLNQLIVPSCGTFRRGIAYQRRYVSGLTPTCGIAPSVVISGVESKEFVTIIVVSNRFYGIYCLILVHCILLLLFIHIYFRMCFSVTLLFLYIIVIDVYFISLLSECNGHLKNGISA